MNIDEFMKIEMPIFKPQYDTNEKYGYKNKYEGNLANLLYSTTDGYCMYCFCKISIDSKRFGQLEHSIEKVQATKLKNCVLNIGLACPKCNTSFKRRGEKSFLLSKKEKKIFESSTCLKSNCKKECREYKKIKRRYVKARKIILQPNGVTINNRCYKIQYNLFNFCFEPFDGVPYREGELEIINSHISKFNLNDCEYRTKELLYFCEDIINGDKNIRKRKYNNMLVDLFIEKVLNIPHEDLVKLCERIYLRAVIKNII